MSKGDYISVSLISGATIQVTASRRGRSVRDWIDPAQVKGPRYLHVEEVGPTGKVSGTTLRVRLDHVASIKFYPNEG